jgi:tyrosine-protein phosphatase YwqE
MFSFFQRKKIGYINALSFLKADMHNHLLPGIDDGSPDMETSMLLADGLQELGFTHLTFTPHILSDVHLNNQSTIEQAFTKLMPEIAHRFPALSLNFAAEYMLDFLFEDLLAKGDILCFGKQRYVLIEMSYLVESPNLRQMIFSLLTRGYQPILAHPERYHYFHQRFSFYETLVDAGCELQLNLLSLGGFYGPHVVKTARKLIKNGLVSWVGTDMHHTGHLDALRNLADNKRFRQQLDLIKNIKNPSLLE